MTRVFYSRAPTFPKLLEWQESHEVRGVVKFAVGVTNTQKGLSYL